MPSALAPVAVSSEAAAPETRRAEEKSRRFMVEFIFGDPSRSRKWGAEFNAPGCGIADSRRTSRRLDLDPDRGDGVAALAKALFEARHELAQLGGDGGIGAEQRPAGLVERPGANARRERRGQERQDRGVHGVRFAQAVDEA